MSFTTISTAEIAVGESVSNATLTKVKENFDNLDDRLTTVEGGGNTTYQPITLGVHGPLSQLSIPYTGFLKTTCNFNLTVTGVRILIDVAGSSGTTEIDLKFKRGGGAYTSIFSTKPSVLHSAGNDSISSNAVLDPTYVDLQTGDIIRLDITGAQVASKNFLVRIDFVKT